MILPIHLLDTGDELDFGKEYILLSKLHRLGFPVATGFVVSPPQETIRHFLIDHSVFSLREFEIKREKLSQLLLDHSESGDSLSSQEQAILIQYWPVLVKRWMIQLHSHFTRFDRFEKKHFALKAAPFFITADILAEGSAQWDPVLEHVHIELTSGQLDHGYLAYIDDLVRKMNKKLGISYWYQFVYTKEGLQIVHLQPFKHREIANLKSIEALPRKVKNKRRLKLYATFAGHLMLDEYCDGYLLESQRFNSHDQKQLVLLETMIAKHPQIILYQVSERYYKSDAAAIKFCRNQKKQDNIELVFRADDGKEQLMQLKRDLAAEGLTRKGKMKYWIRIALPAIALQAGELTEQDFDGVIFDIDFLAAALHGRDITDQGLASDIEGLVRFLDPHIKQLRKKQIPVMLHGQLINEESMIKQSIGWQINGLIVEADSEKMDQTVAFQEQLIGFNLV
jgi:hypothetical protein